MHSRCKLSINYVGGAQRTGGSIQLDSDQFPLSALHSVMADPYLHFTFDTSISGMLSTAYWEQPISANLVGILSLKENIAGNFDTFSYFLMKQLSQIILYCFESTNTIRMVKNASAILLTAYLDTTVYTERPHSDGDCSEEPNDQFPGPASLISIRSKPINPASFG